VLAVPGFGDVGGVAKKPLCVCGCGDESVCRKERGLERKEVMMKLSCAEDDGLGKSKQQTVKERGVCRRFI
jgi:hypothetical protein